MYQIKTACDALADRINETAAPQDRVTGRSLMDKVRNVEGKREFKIDNVKNKKTDPDFNSAYYDTKAEQDAYVLENTRVMVLPFYNERILFPPRARVMVQKKLFRSWLFR